MVLEKKFALVPVNLSAKTSKCRVPYFLDLVLPLLLLFEEHLLFGPNSGLMKVQANLQKAWGCYFLVALPTM